jgi:hypothetical protein
MEIIARFYHASSMRPRFLALLILGIFTLLPGTLYWYFYRENISAIIFKNPQNINYRVRLEGRFSLSYFPLLDRVFVYESLCRDACIFSPLPPLRYELTLMSSGRVTVTDSIELDSGETKKYIFKLAPGLESKVVDFFSPELFEDPSIIGRSQEGDMLSL